MKNSTVGEVLHTRPFLFLWLSQIFSQIAFNMLNFVLVFRVYQLTQKNSAVSALVLSFMLPQLFLSLFAGVLVDRFEKKFVMLVTNAVRAVILLLLILSGSNIAVLYVCAFAIATATQFFLPAEVPMIPQLVKQRLLLSANSLFTATLYGSIILGYVFAGPSLKFLGITTTLFILAVLFSLASLSNTLLPGKQGVNYFREQIQRFSGFTYKRLINILFNDIGELLYIILRNQKIFFGLMFLTISQSTIITVGALLPGYATTILSLDPEDASLTLLAPAALGMIIGSIFIARKSDSFHRRRLIVPAVILSGTMFLFLSFFSRFNDSRAFIAIAQYIPFNLLALVVTVCFFIGFFNALITVPANTIIQENSTESIRGRIYGLFNALTALFSLIPVAITGYLSDLFGVGKVFTSIGISIILFGILPLLFRKVKF